MCALTGASLGALAIGFVLSWGALIERSILLVHADVIENCAVKITAGPEVSLHCNSSIAPDVKVLDATDTDDALLVLVNF